MNELIKIQDHNGKKAVSARELYEKLGYDLSNWKKWYVKNITENQFAVENDDFVQLVLSTRTQDFALSIDFAKKLSMMARTEVGERIRDYFIEVEKKSNIPAIDFTNPATVLQLAQNWADEQAKRIEAEKQAKALEQEIQLKDERLNIQETVIKAAAPKIEYHDTVLQSEGLISVTEMANELGFSSAKSLNMFLKQKGVIRKVNGTWAFCAKYSGHEYGRYKTHPYLDHSGQTQTSHHLYFTELGRKFLLTHFNLRAVKKLA